VSLDKLDKSLDGLDKDKLREYGRQSTGVIVIALIKWLKKKGINFDISTVSCLLSVESTGISGKKVISEVGESSYNYSSDGVDYESRLKGD
jgi:hypothetical protein